jgi:gamma-glutamyltranspeptidase/glutathione hydrolase
VIRGIAASASDPSARDAAQAALEAGGSAIDAVLSGFFAAAGANPAVLFAPAVALVVGIGAGARAFDGRSAQPGTGAARPRGFVAGASIPEAARVSAPRAVGMAALLHATRGRVRFADVVRPGVAAAQAVGEKRRAELLRRVASMGALALRGDFARAAVDAAGPVAGGLLTAEDLELAPAEADATASPLDDAASALAPPWAPADDAATSTRVVLAGDARGLLAAIAFTPPADPFPVAGAEVALARGAVPVLRGVTRVAPGTPLEAPAPIAAVTREGSRLVLVALPGRARIDARALRPLATDAPAPIALAELRGATGADTALAIAWDGRASAVLGAGD